MSFCNFCLLIRLVELCPDFIKFQLFVCSLHFLLTELLKDECFIEQVS